jgi:hypothetical protein
MIQHKLCEAISPLYPFPPPPAMIEAPRPDAEREREAIKDADYWEQRALAAEDAVQDMAWDLHNRDKAELAPKQPHPHGALHRAIGVSHNGGHDPQTHNQVFWERLP